MVEGTFTLLTLPMFPVGVPDPDPLPEPLPDPLPEPDPVPVCGLFIGVSPVAPEPRFCPVAYPNKPPNKAPRAGFTGRLTSSTLALGIPVAPTDVVVVGAVAIAGVPLRLRLVGSTDCGSAIFCPYAIPKLLSQFVSVTGVNLLTSTLVGGV